MLQRHSAKPYGKTISCFHILKKSLSICEESFSKINLDPVYWHRVIIYEHFTYTTRESESVLNLFESFDKTPTHQDPCRHSRIKIKTLFLFVDVLDIWGRVSLVSKQWTEYINLIIGTNTLIKCRVSSSISHRQICSQLLFLPSRSQSSRRGFLHVRALFTMNYIYVNKLYSTSKCIEVWEGFCTSVWQNMLVAIKF